MIRRTILALVIAALPLRAAALETDELLALVAMPLAVAAVSEVTDVPAAELIDMVTLLNQADVPPAQFLEVVRYVPVVIDEPRFIETVRVHYDDGLRGESFVTAVERDFATLGLSDVDLTVTAPRLAVFDGNDGDFVVKTHPHGGPPGQLKKQAGVQTGAEIVHGSARTPRTVAATTNRDDGSDDRGRGRRPRKIRAEDNDAKPEKQDKGNKGNNGKGKGKG